MIIPDKYDGHKKAQRRFGTVRDPKHATFGIQKD